MSVHLDPLSPKTGRLTIGSLCLPLDITKPQSARLAELHHFDVSSASVTTYGLVSIISRDAWYLNSVRATRNTPPFILTDLARRRGMGVAAAAYDRGLSAPVLECVA